MFLLGVSRKKKKMKLFHVVKGFVILQKKDAFMKVFSWNIGKCEMEYGKLWMAVRMWQRMKIMIKKMILCST